MTVYMCTCGFATDDEDWLDSHLDEHPGHFRQRPVWHSPPRLKAGPWTVPDRDEARRIVLQLKDPRWHITPAYYSQDGKWRARHGDAELTAATLGGLMDECEEFVLLQQAATGALWDAFYVPGEPDIGPLASVLVFHRATGVDSRGRLPRHARLRAPRIYRPRAELPQRGR